MYRVEDKYVCSKNELYILQKRLETILPSDSNQIKEEGYVISSVYFDDLCDSDLQDTIEGNRQRKKYRIRIYNRSLDVIKLEVKYKKYNRVLKKSRTISAEQMDNLLKGECVEEETYGKEDPIDLFNLAIKNRGLKAKVIVEYDRKAFVYEPGNVRITLDRNLRGSKNVEKFGKKDMIFDRVKKEPDVLEVKYDEFLPGFISQTIEIGNLNQVSFSKYRICRELVGGR